MNFLKLLGFGLFVVGFHHLVGGNDSLAAVNSTICGAYFMALGSILSYVFKITK